MAAESLFRVRKTALGQEIKSGGITKTFEIVAAKLVALNTGVMDALPQSTTSVVASPDFESSSVGARALAGRTG
jgi:hypothetical protein